MLDYTNSYWMDAKPLGGKLEKPTEGGICIIGSGLTGVSAAYWLLERGFNDITIVDFEHEKAATYRNCGHILYGTVESMKALTALHGETTAREIWDFSIGICHEVRDTIQRLGIEAEYAQDGYLVIAIDKTEDEEIKESVALLNKHGFQSEYVDRAAVSRLGFKNTFGARFEKGSAKAHPVKFRNGLLKHCLARGVKYFSGVKVSAVEETNGRVEVTSNYGSQFFDAAVIGTSAYSPLVSRYFAERRLVEPYKGQIITSKPLKHDFKVKFPHSFDHGYEYSLVTVDNRLMIGGWRNHTPNMEMGNYDVIPGKLVEDGLKNFVETYYDIKEKVEWEYSWAGIMDASRTGFPFIGPTSSPLIFTCSGYTGHGFSWAHGSAKLLADIMAGNDLPSITKYFRPH